jgi:hypothetical protein
LGISWSILSAWWFRDSSLKENHDPWLHAVETAALCSALFASLFALTASTLQPFNAFYF